MKHKNRNVCDNCRRRKLGCDGKSPECTQCIFSGYCCGGYSTDWTFVQQTSHDQKYRRLSADSSRQDNSRSVILDQTFPMTPQVRHRPSTTHLLTVIAENYLPDSERNVSPLSMSEVSPRICGSWVELLYALPCIAHSDSIIFKAVITLASAVLASVDPSHGFYEQYWIAIRSLRQKLERGEGSAHEFIPTIMCLILVEVMTPNATIALDAHLNALGTLFKSCGPAACKTGILHRMFLGFRPLMITHAVQTRQPTFLSHPVWIEATLSEAKLSVVQIFLSEYVHLPSLLHENDCLSVNSPESCRSESEPPRTGIRRDLKEIYFRLVEWESYLQVGNSSESQSYWYEDIHTCVIPNPNHVRVIAYPNVTMANLYTYLWAFKIICLQELAAVGFPQHEAHSHQLGKSTSACDDCTVGLARRVYLSMDFLLREDMRLFGPASSYFPLLVSWKILKCDGDAFDRSYIQLLVDRLVDRGLLSTPELMIGP